MTEESISSLSGRFNHLTIEFQEAYSSINKRFTVMEEKFTTMESKIDDRLSSIENSLRELTKSTSSRPDVFREAGIQDRRLVSPVNSSNSVPFGSDSHDVTSDLGNQGDEHQLGTSRDRLFALKQTGSVLTYTHEFEFLSSKVRNLSAEMLEGIFVSGLKPEVQDLVKFLKPEGLEEAILAATRSESTVLCRVVAEAMDQTAKP